MTSFNLNQNMAAVIENAMIVAVNTAGDVLLTQDYAAYYHTLVQSFLQNRFGYTYDDFKARTRRATLPLQNHQEAVFYSVSYGLQHHMTFKNVLKNVVFDHAVTTFNVFDYACGQGVATITLLEYLATQVDAGTVTVHVHLIEPSCFALSIAEFLIARVAEKHGFNVTMTRQNAYFSRVVLPVHLSAAHGVTFHLMSYILDVAQVQADLPCITRQMLQMQGQQIVIATDIDHTDATWGFNRLSHALPVPAPHIVSYRLQHRSFNVMKGGYAPREAKAIGMVLSFTNDDDMQAA